MTSNKFRFAPGIDSVSEVNSAEICNIASFRFDKPIACRADDEIELKDGQWYLIRNGISTLIEGMWKSNQ